MRAHELGQYEKSMPNTLTQREKPQLRREFGLDYLEMSVDESDEKLVRLQYTREERGAIVRAMEATGVRIHFMCLSRHRKCPLGHPDEHIQKKAPEIMEAAIQPADDLGIRIIQFAGYGVYYEAGNEQTRKNFIQNLSCCVELAAKKGILLGFETMETPFMDTVEKSMAYAQQVHSPYLGVYPDTGSPKNTSLLYRKNVNEDIQTGKGRIVAAHLKETIPGHYHEIPFGGGHTEFVENIRELKQQGVRMSVGEFWYTGDSDWRKDCVDAVVFLRSKSNAAFQEEAHV